MYFIWDFVFLTPLKNLCQAQRSNKDFMHLRRQQQLLTSMQQALKVTGCFITYSVLTGKKNSISYKNVKIYKFCLEKTALFFSRVFPLLCADLYGKTTCWQITFSFLMFCLRFCIAFPLSFGKFQTGVAYKILVYKFL